MQAQQLYDYIIKPTHEYMGGNYESKNANFLSLCTAAIESHCGYYIKQVGGPALGIWQMEPDTEHSILIHCDALQCEEFSELIFLTLPPTHEHTDSDAMMVAPMYACAMARLKYSMDSAPLPDHKDIKAVYAYYKRIYNTPLGASTFDKFEKALVNNGILKVKL